MSLVESPKNRSAGPGVAQGALLRPMFIVGCGRSGTTLLRLMLNAHPEVAIPDESYFIQAMWKAFPSPEVYPAGMLEKIIGVIEHPKRSNYKSWGLDQHVVRQRLRALSEPTHADVLNVVFSAYAQQHGKRRWGDKTPSYVETLEIIHRMCPQARIVHLIRDGRAVCESYLRQSFGPRTVTELAKLWVERVERGRRVGRTLPSENYLEVRYEELVARPEPVLRQLCDFVGLSFDPIMLNHASVASRYVEPEDRQGKHQHSCSPLDASLSGQWKARLPVRQQLLFQGLAGRTLKACGYSIEPDPRQPVFTLLANLSVALYGLRRVPGKLARWRRKRTAGGSP